MYKVQLVALIFLAGFYTCLPAQADPETPVAIESYSNVLSFFKKWEGGSWSGKMKITRVASDGSLSVLSAQGGMAVMKEATNQWRVGEGFCTTSEISNFCWDALSGFKLTFLGLFTGFGGSWTPVRVIESTPTSLVYFLKTNDFGVIHTSTVHMKIILDEGPKPKFLRQDVFRENGKITQSRVFSGVRD